MKVAVASINPHGSQGRSSVIATVASTYSLSHEKRVAVFSTGSMDVFKKSMEVKDIKTPSRSAAVYRALLSSEQLSDSEFLDYGSRVGQEEVYLFDIFSDSISQIDVEEMFLKTIHRVDSDLVLVEIDGDIEEKFNAAVVESCDVLIMIFTCDHKSFGKVKDFIVEKPYELTRKTGFLCNKYDRTILSEKELSKMISYKQRSTLIMPRNALMSKLCLEGKLNKIGGEIVEGNPDAIELRMRVKEFLSFLFDTTAYKVIKEVTQWRRS